MPNRLMLPLFGVLLIAGCGGAPSAQVTDAKLGRITSAANEQPQQEVITTWMNTGDTTIRAVDADITAVDKSGRTLVSVNYTIYAVSDDEPGVAPGETYTTPEGSGFRLPNHPAVKRASRVDVQITKALEHSGF